jgi:hypothetical protein
MRSIRQPLRTKNIRLLKTSWELNIPFTHVVNASPQETAIAGPPTVEEPKNGSPSPVLTRCGTRWRKAWPSCPCSLDPHVYTSPWPGGSEIRALIYHIPVTMAVCAVPQASCVTLSRQRAGTRVGFIRHVSSVAPIPSCPSAQVPQPQTYTIKKHHKLKITAAPPIRLRRTDLEAPRVSAPSQQCLPLLQAACEWERPRWSSLLLLRA